MLSAWETWMVLLFIFISVLWNVCGIIAVTVQSVPGGYSSSGREGKLDAANGNYTLHTVILIPDLL